MAVTLDQLEQLYLAYFGRPADFQGVAFYTADPTVTLDDVAATFGNSAESQRLYGTNIGPAFVNAIYQNLFGRDADSAGLLFWTQRLALHDITPGGAALAILQGATNGNGTSDAPDLTMIQNKLAAATAFTNALTSGGSTAILGYSGDNAAALAREQLSTVTADSTTLTTYVANVDAELAAVVAVGGEVGQTFVMTTGVDNITATNATVIDTVQGTINNDGTTDGSTFSAADKITGNGKTIVDVVVKAAAVPAIPFVAIKDVASVNFTNAAAAANVALTVDGSAWTNVGTVALTGKGGADITVNGLSNDKEAFGAKIAGATTGTIAMTGAAGSWNIAGSIQNNAKGTSDVGFQLGAGSVSLNVGKSGYAAWTVSRTTSSATKNVSLGDVNFGAVNVKVGANVVGTLGAPGATLHITQSATAQSGFSASVGNVNVGSVNVAVGASGYATQYVSNYAKATGTSAIATAGSMSIGNITVTAGTAAKNSMTVYNSAYASGATSAAASVGDMTIGSINLTGKTGAAFVEHIYNSATGDDGAASVGDFHLGFLGVNVGKTGSADVELYNDAYAYGNGTTSAHASAGDFTIGSVNITAAKSANVDVNVSNTASAWGASTLNSASVGNMSIGDIAVTGKGSVSLTFENTAEASFQASAGSMTIGNVSISGGTAAHDLYFYNSASAYHGASVGDLTVGNLSVNSSNRGLIKITASASSWSSGAATVGNITVGDVSIASPATKSANNDVSLYAYAYAGSGSTASASIGSTTIGNVNMAVASGSNELYVYQYASAYGTTSGSASVGSLTMGSVTMNGLAANAGGTNELYVYRSAYNDSKGDANIGSLTIGDININAGGITQVSGVNEITVYNSAYAYSGAATVGSITLGDITAKTGINGQVYVYVEANADGATGGDSTGMVTIGDVAMTGSQGADLTLEAYNYASSGDAGGITVGNVSMKGAAFAELYVSNSASYGNAGTVTVGNVAITADAIELDIGNTASNDGNAAGLTVGNVSLKGANAAGTNWIWQYANGNAGALTVGDVSLSDKSGQTLSLHVENSSTGTVGTETIGNITISLASKDAGATPSSITFDATTDGGTSTGGNIVAGNITIGSSGVTTKGTFAAGVAAGHVTLDSTDGTVTVGNITVTGGVAHSDGLTPPSQVVVDNLANLSAWLTLSGSKVTVGNVDYSGYAAKATIDVTAFTGAASIKGSTAGSTITDNKGVNAITFSDTTKADFVYFQDVQTGVKDSGTAITASQTALDSITGWAAGDKLTLVHTASGVTTVTGIGGNGTIVQNTPSQDFATFLTHSEQQIDGAGNSAYVAVIGGNTYVALADNAGHVGQIVEIMGSHTFGLAADATAGLDLVFAS
jgi:hypothetical protein